MLVLKHIEYPNRSEHWSLLDSGEIHVTGYSPEAVTQTGSTTMSRKTALKALKISLKAGWIIMVNSLFTQEEL